MIEALTDHWPEYAIEAFCLGAFMVSAAVFGTWIYHPASPIARTVPDSLERNAVMGLAMALTAVALFFSPWGKRSGAHMNPATTLAFFRLGKIAPWDATFYVLAQFAGGIAGVWIAYLIVGASIADPAVAWVVTVPGPTGAWVAFLAEIAIAYVMLLTVLYVSNVKRLARWTGLFAAALLFLYITFEAPYSGMSLNPARTFGSAVFAHRYDALWVYFAAPVLGMLLAAETFVRVGRLRTAHCAKYHHENSQPCIFNCRYGELR